MQSRSFWHSQLHNNRATIRAGIYLIKLGSVGIEEEKDRLEDKVLSFRAYPNPFTHKTVFHIWLPGSSQPAQITIHNTAGRLVKTFGGEPGDWMVEWDGTDNNKKKLKSGIYFVRVSAGPFIATEKVILR